MCSKPIFEIFDQESPISIYRDASIQGIKQRQPNGKEKPVAYFSKKPNEEGKKIYI